jgi:hypothetical protein
MGNLELITCDPVEAYRRHLLQCESEPSTISSYFTEGDVFHWFASAIHLHSLVGDVIAIEKIHIAFENGPVPLLGSTAPRAN